MQWTTDEAQALEKLRDAAEEASCHAAEALDTKAAPAVAAAHLEAAGRALDTINGLSLTPFIVKAQAAHAAAVDSVVSPKASEKKGE